MKGKSICLIIIAFIVSGILPVTNFLTGSLQLSSSTTLVSLQSAAFKTDYYTGLGNVIRYHLGGSSSPSQAVVGYKGWLFLGDQYEKSISVSRSLISITPEGMAARRQWRDSLLGRLEKDFGVRAYVSVAPNKEEVYRELLPKWAQPIKGPTYFDLVSRENDRFLISLHRDVKDARNKYADPIYFETDSHWNDIGAWEGYKVIAGRLKKDIPGLVVLGDSDVVIKQGAKRTGGDISSFLFIRNYIEDSSPSVTTRQAYPISINNLVDGKIEYSGNNITVGVPRDTVEVRSPNALNKLRVLWLRDSFGTHASPFMAATFSDVIQRHWSGYYDDESKLRSLVQEVKPDIVLISIVSRLEVSLMSSRK